MKIPTGVKLKHLPLEQKVALRLVSLAEHGKTQASVRQLAKQTGGEFMPTMMCVTSLHSQGVLSTVKPLTVDEFEFTVEPTHLQALKLNASNYLKHVVTRMNKPPGRACPPPHLPPINLDQRALHLSEAMDHAKSLGAPKLTNKLANCIARLGREEVQKIMDATEAESAKSGISRVAAFFRLYTVRRDDLVPAHAPVHADGLQT